MPVSPNTTPAAQYRYTATVVSFDTGTPQVTRITAMTWKIVDLNTNQFDAEPNMRLRLVDPNGEVRLSDISGAGGTDSTCRKCGDNRRMNCKIEFAPYLPGTYYATLIQAPAGDQVSNEVTFTLSASPLQYVHIDFIPNE